MAGLEDLVPDVLYVLLLRAPSMQTLWVYIRASPNMYEVFRNRRDIILSTIGSHEIGPGILGVDQSALDSSRSDSWGLLEPRASDWIMNHQAAMTGSPVKLGISRGLKALPLWRTHRDVNFFADLLVRGRLHIPEGTDSVGQVGRLGLDGISETEN